MPLTLEMSCKTTFFSSFKYGSSQNNKNNKNKNNFNRLSKALPTKNPNKNKVSPPPPFHLKRKSDSYPPPKHAVYPKYYRSRQTHLLVDAFDGNIGLKSLLEKLNRRGSDPVQILSDDGDWTEENFWVVIRFLKMSSRSKDIPQVFDLWKIIEKSRINHCNYEKIIGLLLEEGLMEEAISAVQEMMGHGLKPSLAVFNPIIRGFALKGSFEDALYYFKEIEDTGLKPDTCTYDGLIQGYGKHRMYDEIGQCVKKMEADGCLPDHITYNLLIQEFSRAGLLTRMERLYQTLISKRMDPQHSTLVAMLEAYAKFGILDKMEKVYRWVLCSEPTLKEDLIRKLARVYIMNHMFSRLDDLGLDLSSKIGMTDLVLCLHILSHACLLSRNGMDSVIQEMESKKLPWNITVANVILLACVKMKDFTRLKVVLSELPARHVKPDIVTFGVVFDAYKIGFDGMWALNTWRKMGLLDEVVEMKTDALVLTAFGKGHFLRSCEEMYCSLQTEARERRIWSYQRLIDLVFEQNKRLPQLMAVEQT